MYKTLWNHMKHYETTIVVRTHPISSINWISSDKGCSSSNHNVKICQDTVVVTKPSRGASQKHGHHVKN